MRWCLALVRLCAVCWMLMVALRAHGDEPLILTILHTNDLGGLLLPSAYYDEPERGGFARLLGVLKSQGAPESTLVLDGGDALGDAPLARFDSGRLVAELMKAGRYAAMVSGNHEFDYGLDTLGVRIGEMGFPMLAANLEMDGNENSPLGGWTLLERGGIGVALIGLLDPALSQVINPRRNPGLRITDPHAALEEVLAELPVEADYVIALLHMEEERAVQLAKGTDRVDLYLAGGFSPGQRKGGMSHRIELADGGRLLTTPGRGAFVGRIDLKLERTTGGIVERGFSARLLPVDAEAAPDADAAARIGQLDRESARADREPIGYIGEEAGDTPLFAAEALRTAERAEVGVLNMGCLYPVALEDTVTRGDLQRLIRFDNLLVTIDVTGRELAAIAASSEQRVKYGQKLVFAGFDPATGRVNGRKLEKDEVYRVATTAFLAEGGDAHFTPRQQRYRHPPAEELSRAVVDHLRRPSVARDGALYGIWKWRTKASGSLTWSEVNERAGEYGDVSFLGGRGALAWNSLIDTRLSYETVVGRLVGQGKSSFGQVRTGGQVKEAADRLQVDVVYTRETFVPAPFVGLALNTVWTASAEEERPLSLRASLGLHKNFGERAKVRVGLGAERDLAARESELGLEITPEYRRQFRGKNSVASNGKVFLGATQTRTVSIQHYNNLTVHLRSDLHVTLDANFFIHRSSAVGEVGVKSEIQAGLGYSWNEKWF